MTKRLACADITIMAGQAVAGICARVVKRRASKGRGDMAIGAILIVGTGRYVVREFTHANHIVVARITVICDAGMIIDASSKGSRGMTKLAILVDVDIDDVDRHVLVERGGKRNTCRRNTVTGIAASCQHSRVSVVDAKCGDKTSGGMARSTIGCSSRVGGYCGSFSGRVDTIASIVAGFTRLYRCVQ